VSNDDSTPRINTNPDLSPCFLDHRPRYNLNSRDIFTSFLVRHDLSEFGSQFFIDFDDLEGHVAYLEECIPILARIRLDDSNSRHSP
jgi:hypothetical protein